MDCWHLELLCQLCLPAVRRVAMSVAACGMENFRIDARTESNRTYWHREHTRVLDTTYQEESQWRKPCRSTEPNSDWKKEKLTPFLGYKFILAEALSMRDGAQLKAASNHWKTGILNLNMFENRSKTSNMLSSLEFGVPRFQTLSRFSRVCRHDGNGEIAAGWSVTALSWGVWPLRVSLGVPQQLDGLQWKISWKSYLDGWFRGTPICRYPFCGLLNDFEAIMDFEPSFEV